MHKTQTLLPTKLKSTEPSPALHVNIDVLLAVGKYPHAC